MSPASGSRRLIHLSPDLLSSAAASSRCPPPDHFPAWPSDPSAPSEPSPSTLDALSRFGPGRPRPLCATDAQPHRCSAARPQRPPRPPAPRGPCLPLDLWPLGTPHPHGSLPLMPRASEHVRGGCCAPLEKPSRLIPSETEALKPRASSISPTPTPLTLFGCLSRKASHRKLPGPPL